MKSYPTVRADNNPPQHSRADIYPPQHSRADNNPPRLPERKFIRKRGYNYSNPGFYFITINTQNKAHLFGSILAERDSKARIIMPLTGVMLYTEAGKLALQCWEDIPKHFPNVVVHACVVMPNHLHGLIEITDLDTEKKSKLGAIVRGLKIGITKWFRLNSDIEKVWQRDYFERIISDPNQFNNTKNYIEQNINKWAKKELSHKLYC